MTEGQGEPVLNITKEVPPSPPVFVRNEVEDEDCHGVAAKRSRA